MASQFDPPPQGSFVISDAHIPAGTISPSKIIGTALTDAPSDSGKYSRRNGAWVTVTDGTPGPQGSPGAQGQKGDTGTAGGSGSQGPKGDTGSQGIQGIQGIQGGTGAKGDTGTAGGQGIQGIQGVAGSPGTTDYTALSNKPTFGTAAAANKVAAGQAGVLDATDSSTTNARTPTTHSHVPGDVTGTAVVTGDSRLSDARTPVSHDSTKHSVTYALPGDITTHAALATGVHGAGANSLIYSNDTRLSDARTPTTHDSTKHSVTYEVTSAKAAASGYASLDASSKLVQARARADDGLGYVALTNDTLAQNFAVNSVTRLTVTAARTLTTTVPPAGCAATLLILTSGTSSYVITFGTGFKAVGTLSTGTVSAMVFVVSFISNGTSLYESGRTAAMAA